MIDNFNDLVWNGHLICICLCLVEVWISRIFAGGADIRICWVQKLIQYPTQLYCWRQPFCTAWQCIWAFASHLPKMEPRVILPPTLHIDKNACFGPLWCARWCSYLDNRNIKISGFLVVADFDGTLKYAYEMCHLLFDFSHPKLSFLMHYCSKDTDTFLFKLKWDWMISEAKQP